MFQTQHLQLEGVDSAKAEAFVRLCLDANAQTLLLSKKKAKRFTSRNSLLASQLDMMQLRVLQAYRLVPTDKQATKPPPADDMFTCLPVGSAIGMSSASIKPQPTIKWSIQTQGQDQGKPQ
jgi:hypothetical protein